MNIHFIKLIVFFLLINTSCSSKKNIVYLQKPNSYNFSEISYKSYLLKVDDILKIDVRFHNPNFPLSTNSNSNSNTNNKDSFLLNGYQVDADGYINYPEIGKIFCLDKSIIDLQLFITSSFISKEIYVNPVVDVKLLNSSFTILGEVQRPGNYNFLENNLNVFEAIGMAGDLTINGKRNEVRLIRELNEKRVVISFDLTSSEFVNTNYQVFPGDILIVNPNSSRIKNAGIIGNSGTLLSLLSFILSSIIVISR